MKRAMFAAMLTGGLILSGVAGPAALVGSASAQVQAACGTQASDYLGATYRTSDQDMLYRMGDDGIVYSNYGGQTEHPWGKWRVTDKGLEVQGGGSPVWTSTFRGCDNDSKTPSFLVFTGAGGHYTLEWIKV
ncbi:hypothetical protein ACGF8B_37920 [Streptomyces sp. NPDC047917]|uniref:hypothetical protein n=1 Tax=Streptomyces sp. NPDC047917 TaxID=3365491 RepID=UPI00370F7C7D